MRTLVCEGFGGFYGSRGMTSIPLFRSLFLVGVLMSVFWWILFLVGILLSNIECGVQGISL